MPSKFERPAKLIVTALCRGPGVAAEQLGHMAVERVAGWFGPEERSRYDRLVRQVEDRLSSLPAHEIGGAQRLEQALITAEAHFREAGLTIDDLIRRNLDSREAVAEQQARFDRWPPGQGADVGPICREHVIPAVFEALFADEGALAEIDLAFKQAVLAKLDVIERESDVAGALKAMAAEAVLARPRVLAWSADRHPPSALLVPERGIVAFAGRAQLEQELLAWCEAPADIGVQLLFGPGGMGKTRFAHELCRQAEARRWRAGFLQRRLADVPGWLAPQLDAMPEPLLIVIDYAEDKPEEVARAFELAARRPTGRKLRLLMLARGTGDWWRTLPELGPAVRDLWDGPAIGAPREITALTITAQERRTEFGRAREAFARHLPPVEQAGAPPDLGSDDFAPVLMTHMAALAAAEGKTIANADELFEYILAREAELWTRGAKARGLELSTDALRQGIALLTLTQGAADAQEAERILREAPLLRNLAADPLHRALGLIHQIYPTAGSDPRRVEPLRPDLLGEELIDRALAQWPELLDRALAVGPDRALLPLGRLAVRHQQAGRLLPYEQLAKLEGALPEHTLALREVAALVLGQMHARLIALPQPWAEKTASEAARVCNNLAIRLSELGRGEDALAAAEKAVRLRRTLAAARPDAFNSHLAGALGNLANLLSALGRREDALAAGLEARDLYRALATERPDASTPDLARAFNDLAIRLSDLGRREDALAAAEEAVRLCRKQAAAEPDDFNPQLAMALNNLAKSLSDLGRREDALAAAEEAVRLRRKQAAAEPDAFTSGLAIALINLAACLSDLSRREDALAAGLEAGDLYRALAAARPDAFTPDLAMALNNLAKYLSDLGQREDALAAAEEARDLYRALAAARPDAFIPNLAIALNNLSNRLSDLGRREDALAAAEEARDLHRALATARPDVFTPDLAVSLALLANCLEAVERTSEALTADREAMATLHAPFLTHPPAFAHWMAPMCRQYVERCEKLGQEPDRELLGPVAEALQRMRQVEP